MTDYDAYIGLDVHKDSISVAIADAGRSGEVRLFGAIPNDLNLQAPVGNSAS